MAYSVFVDCPNAACSRFTLTELVFDAEYVGGSSYVPSALPPLATWQLVPESDAKIFSDYVPEPIRDDYREACLIRELSPKASATLARRCGRLVASVDGQRVFGECKGGPLSRSSEGKERVRLVAAVGQLVCARLPAEVLAVAAVPDTPEFRRLVELMSEGTMAAEAGIRMALVGRNTSVDGLW